MNIKILCTLSLALCFVSCSNNDNLTPEALCNEEKYGQGFVVVPRERYCFSDDTELLIVSLNNEFCPCNVACIWEGQMTINMEWTLPDGEVLEYKYNELSQVDALPYGIVISYDLDDVSFAEECSESVPNPEIIEAIISISQ